MRDGDSVDGICFVLLEGAISVSQGFFDDGQNDFDMRAGGYFRNDAAVFGMDIDL